MPLRAWIRLTRKSPPSSALVTASETTALIIVLLLLLRHEGVPVGAVGLGSTTLAHFLVYSAISTGVIVGLDVLALRLARSTSASAENREAKPTEARLIDKQITRDSMPQGKELIGFVPVCLLGAVWEELCFRGVALHLAAPTIKGTIGLIGLSSFIFALHHLRRGLTAAVYSGFYGVLFSLLYLGGGSLPPVMFAHAFGNLFVVLYTAPRLRASICNPPPV